LSPKPFTNPVGPPHSDQNLHDDAQLPLGNMSIPQISDHVITFGGCPVEEEIPPIWMEDTTGMTKPIGNSIPTIHPNSTMGGCVIEEEIPPQWLDDSIKVTNPNVNLSLNDATET
jgi:hypothetical protein